MIFWCALLFMLGVTAFLDAIFNYGEIYRRINSVLFMLISLALLVRTTFKIRSRVRETYEDRIEMLTARIRELQHNQISKREQLDGSRQDSEKPVGLKDG